MAQSPFVEAGVDALFGRPTRIINGQRVYADVIGGQKVGSEVGGQFDTLTADIPDPSRDEGFLFHGVAGQPTQSQEAAKAYRLALAQSLSPGARQLRAL